MATLNKMETQLHISFSQVLLLLSVCCYKSSCAVADTDWQLVFRAVAGVSDPDPYDLWISNIALNENVPKAQELTNNFKGHYKSRTALFWDRLDITEVKVSLYKNDLVTKEITFDGKGSDTLNWFTSSRIKSSPWTDLQPTLSQLQEFSVPGLKITDIGVTRRFYVSKSHAGCANDMGWFAMVSAYGVCDWDHPDGIAHPFFVYSNEATAVTWQSGVVDYADVFAIFIKIKLPGGVQLMKSNARMHTLGTATSYSDLTSAQCCRKCQLNSSCTSFNHHAASLSCELNTDYEVGDGLEHESGWNFYPVDRNPGGMCAVQPCKNEGFCQVASNDVGFRCLCSSNFYGATCSNTFVT